MTRRLRQTCLLILTRIFTEKNTDPTFLYRNCLSRHVQINADDVTLVPDYLVSKKDPSGYKTVHTPLLLTVEAKNENFDEGWAQALLQAVVCQKINDTLEIPVFAIVTTGDLWELGRLEGQLFTRHPIPWAIQNIGGLLAVLDTIFSACENLEAEHISKQTRD